MGVLLRLVAWIVCWRMFLILCCFLLFSLCGGWLCSFVCAVGVLVGLVAWIVCWRMFLILCCFMLPCVCGSFVCSGVSSGTSGVDCVLEDFSNFKLFSVA